MAETVSAGAGRKNFSEVFPFPDVPPGNPEEKDWDPEDAKTRMKDRIFEFAGREATAGYQIASGNHTQNAELEKTLFYEPFTYADWHNLIEAEWEGKYGYRDDKMRLLWERERGYRANGVWNKAPTPKGRWEEFKKRVDNGNRNYVKRIALPNQLNPDDLRWIATNLPELEALDLSALRDDGDAADDDRFLYEGQNWELYLGDSDYVAMQVLEIADLDRFSWLPEALETKADMTAQLAVIKDKKQRAYSLLGDPEKRPLNKRDLRFVLSRAEKEYRDLVHLLVRRQKQHDDWQKQNTPAYSTPYDLEKFMKDIETSLFTNLKWLGIRDWHQCQNDNTATWQKTIDAVLPRCKHITTLSVRGHYVPDPYIDVKDPSRNHGDAHMFVCDLILRITRNVPESMNTLELRMPLTTPQYVLSKLHELKPTITRVGIDLGAWVQVYPIKDSVYEEKNTHYRKDYTDADVQKSAETVALEARFEAYEEACGSNPPISGPWVLPQSSAERLKELSDSRPSWVDYDDEQKAEKPNFYRVNGGSDISDMMQWCVGDHEKCPFEEKRLHPITNAILADHKVTTLPQMLKKLYDSRHKDDGGEQDIYLFPLEPDFWNRSTDPIHPLSLIQTVDEPSMDPKRSAPRYDAYQAGQRYKYLKPDEEMAKVYAWLEQTFGWRPVFDWDWFMVPDRMEDTVDADFKQLFSAEKDTIMERIRHHFHLLREAGIPVHLLIGRRDVKGSSCYWGWPYNAEEWQEWLDKPFDTNLDLIADTVDDLSIFYDLRNPLPKARLEKIDALSSHSGPTARCPSVICPWRKEGEEPTEHVDCPFHAQREPQGYGNKESPIKQKMANKQALRPKKSQAPTSYEFLAAKSSWGPPTGENANDHPSDDSDSDESSSRPPQHANGHHLARKAAFTREAVGWQRFWSTYGLKFTRLGTLRVRMPRCFDQIGSWRLAKLLDQKLNWQMSVFTDERQHMQTAEDVVRTLPGSDGHVFEHEPEERVWPAGRFVRRTWVWPPRRVKSESFIGERHIFRDEFEELLGDTKAPVTILNRRLEYEDTPHWKNRTFIQNDYTETDSMEVQELKKAIERAEAAAAREREFEELPEIVQKWAQYLETKRAARERPRALAQRVWERELESYREPIKTKAETLLQSGDARGHEILTKTLEILRSRREEDVPIFKGQPVDEGFAPLELFNYRERLRIVSQRDEKLLQQSNSDDVRPIVIRRSDHAEGLVRYEIGRNGVRYGYVYRDDQEEPDEDQLAEMKAKGLIGSSDEESEAPHSATKSTSSRRASSKRTSATSSKGKRASFTTPLMPEKIDLEEPDFAYVEAGPRPPQSEDPQWAKSTSSKSGSAKDTSATSSKGKRASFTSPSILQESGLEDDFDYIKVGTSVPEIKAPQSANSTSSKTGSAKRTVVASSRGGKNSVTEVEDDDVPAQVPYQATVGTEPSSKRTSATSSKGKRTSAREPSPEVAEPAEPEAPVEIVKEVAVDIAIVEVFDDYIVTDRPVVPEEEHPASAKSTASKTSKRSSASSDKGRTGSIQEPTPSVPEHEIIDVDEPAPDPTSATLSTKSTSSKIPSQRSSATKTPGKRTSQEAEQPPPKKAKSASATSTKSSANKRKPSAPEPGLGLEVPPPAVPLPAEPAATEPTSAPTVEETEASELPAPPPKKPGRGTKRPTPATAAPPPKKKPRRPKIAAVAKEPEPEPSDLSIGSPSVHEDSDDDEPKPKGKGKGKKATATGKRKGKGKAKKEKEPDSAQSWKGSKTARKKKEAKIDEPASPIARRLRTRKPPAGT